MRFYPDFDEALGYAKEFKRVPVMTEMIADMITPVNVLVSIKNVYDQYFLLESAENERQFGRYSFIGCGAKRFITYEDGCLNVTENGETVSTKTKNPFTFIDETVKNNLMPVMPGMPKFTGGLVGYFGYDTARFAEPSVNNTPKDDLKAPDIQLMDCERIIVFDHLRHRVLLITQASTDGDFKQEYELALARLKEMREFLNDMPPAQKPVPGDKQKADMLVEKKDYMDMVKKAKEYIRNGDIFQVVLSQRIDISSPPDSFNVYRAIRADEPSPYMYYLCFGKSVMAGSSPEKLVSVENGLVTTNPIAGTIKRGKDEAEDIKFEKELINNEKERAEHIMLVDLARNDIGKICRFGTVEVDRLMEIGRFSKLMHIISQVTGTLKESCGAIDALCACLPAGTLSGAPKIRAMQIIDELETRKRGTYGGATGYIGYNGVMDTCITIRTAFFIGEKAYIQTGAGIVADSSPESEYEETRTKATAMLGAFEKAGELI